MRVFLALLLVLTSFPAQAADPLVELLVTHRAAAEPFADKAADDAREAAGEPDPQTLDLGRLASLQAELSMLAQGIEAFRHPSHYAAAHAALMKGLPVEVRPYYEDRDRGLDTIYRTLALIDYTAALRYEDPPCAAREARAALLHAEDGLFVDPKTGAYSPWLRSVLKRARAAEAAGTQRASAASKLEGVEYDRALARVRELGAALKDEALESGKRAESHCARATLYESLASAHRAQGGLVEAGRALDASQRFEGSLAAVAAVTGPRGDAAATALEADGRAVVVTSARMLLDPETGKPPASLELELKDGSRRKASVARWDLSLDLAVLDVEGEGLSGLRFSRGAASRADRVFAAGHPEQGGRWSVTQGMVTRRAATSFQTDALIAPGAAGGPVLDEEGAVLGIARARAGADGALEAGEAVEAAAVRAWLGREAALDAHEAAEADGEPIEDWGTGAILSAASAELAPAGAPIEAGIQGVCVAYCDGPPASSYSSGGGSSGGGEAIVGMAMVLGVAVAGVGYLLWQGLKALAKSMPKVSLQGRARVDPKPSKTRVEKVAQERPKPEPKKPPRLHVELEGPTRLTPGETYEFTAIVKAENDGAVIADGNLDGIKIAISQTVDPSTITVVTGKDGRASFHLTIRSPNVAFRDLDRQAGLIRASAAVASPQALQLMTMASSVVLTATIIGTPVGTILLAGAISVTLYLAYEASKQPPGSRSQQPLPVSPPRPTSAKHNVVRAAESAMDDLERESSARDSDDLSTPAAGEPEDPQDPERERKERLKEALRDTTDDLRFALRRLGVDDKTGNRIIHDLKPRLGRGGRANLRFNYKTGDIISPETGEVEGNLLRYF